MHTGHSMGWCSGNMFSVITGGHRRPEKGYVWGNPPVWMNNPDDEERVSRWLSCTQAAGVELPVVNEDLGRDGRSGCSR